MTRAARTVGLGSVLAAALAAAAGDARAQAMDDGRFFIDKDDETDRKSVV